MDTRTTYRPTDPNEVVALAVNAKRKGWAWTRGRLLANPIDFADPVNTQALVQWFARAHWLDHRATNKFKTHADKTWRDVYAEICLDLAENRMTKSQYATAVRDMTACAIGDLGDKRHGQPPLVVPRGDRPNDLIEGLPLPTRIAGPQPSHYVLDDLYDPTALHRPAFEVLQPRE
jgi:hypothetical protein